MLRIGLLTIGQSPRVDIMEELGEAFVGAYVVEAGALDGYTREEIEASLYPEPGYDTLVTRLRDGNQVSVAKEKILPLIQRKIYELEDRVDLIILLCSGEFPRFKSMKPLIYPDHLLKSIATTIMTPGGRLGVIIPLEAQRYYAKNKWSKYTGDLRIAVASPYKGSEEDFRKAAEEMIDRELVIMDCIGYNYKQKKIVQRIVDKPVITARGVLRSLLNEIIQ